MTDETVAAPATASAVAQAEPEKTVAAVEPKPTEAKAQVDLEAQPDEPQADDEPEKAKPRRESGVVRLKAALAEREAEIERLRSQVSPNASIPGLGDPPKESDYPDYFEFIAAKAAYETEKRLKASQYEATKAARESELVTLNAERQIAYEEARGKARTVIPDFDKVVAESAKSGVQLSRDFAAEIASSDKAPLLEYHLSQPQNWQLLRELNSLSGRELAREIGRLEGRLHWPRPKTQTSAPPPVKPIGSGASTSRSPSEMSYAEFVKYRESGGKISLGG